MKSKKLKITSCLFLLTISIFFYSFKKPIKCVPRTSETCSLIIVSVIENEEGELIPVEEIVAYANYIFVE